MSSSKQAQQRRNRQRQSHRGPRHVEPVLDPTWVSAYAFTSTERDANAKFPRRYALRQLPFIGGTAVILCVTFAVFAPLVILPVAFGAVGYVAWLMMGVRRSERDAEQLAGVLVARFAVGGTALDRKRLTTIVERLSATFGLSDVASFVVDDPVPNATLLSDGDGYSLLVTTGLMHDAELIELEGVVAHCFARQRLGLIERRGYAAVRSGASDDVRRTLSGVGAAFRCDEVAAAAIRYPLGIAHALNRAFTIPANSYFATPAFNVERWVWFNPHVDGAGLHEGDLDGTDVRRDALSEW